VSTIEELGNVELYRSYFSLFQRVHRKTAYECDKDYLNDPRVHNDERYFDKDILKGKEDVCAVMLNVAYCLGYNIDELSEKEKQDLILYLLLSDEIRKREFDLSDEHLGYVMSRLPTYIREIYATDYPGDYLIDTDSTGKLDYSEYTRFDLLSNDIVLLDYPVRKACRVLNDKGYYTYWSSANVEDAEIRTGDVVAGKNVAYILIDGSNLTDELKKELLLDGSCKFWGIALNHSDNGKYYGIWTEITSRDMKCDELSELLVSKALALPEIKREIESKKSF